MRTIQYEGTPKEINALVVLAKTFGWKLQDTYRPSAKTIVLNISSPQLEECDLAIGFYWCGGQILNKEKHTFESAIREIANVGLVRQEGGVRHDLFHGGHCMVQRYNVRINSHGVVSVLTTDDLEQISKKMLKLRQECNIRL